MIFWFKWWSSTPKVRAWIRVLVCHRVLSRGWGGLWWQRQILSALFNPHTFIKLNVKPWFHSVFVCGSVHSCNHISIFFLWWLAICLQTAFAPVPPLSKCHVFKGSLQFNWLHLTQCKEGLKYAVNYLSVGDSSLKSSMNFSSGYFLPNSQMCAPHCQRSYRSINLHVNVAPFGGNVCTTSPCSFPSSIT